MNHHPDLGTIGRTDSDIIPSVIQPGSRSPRAHHAVSVGSTTEWCTDYTDAYRVRAVVLPVGGITPEKFQKYLALIKTFSSLELAQMTRNVGDKARMF